MHRGSARKSEKTEYIYHWIKDGLNYVSCFMEEGIVCEKRKLAEMTEENIRHIDDRLCNHLRAC